MLLWQILRVKQWSKNLLVFLLPLSDGQIIGTNFSPMVIFQCCLGFLAISLVSSGNYLLNDINDVQEDRAHHRKKNRPVASGRIGIRSAYLVAVLTFSTGIATTFLTLGKDSGFFILCFGTVQLLYTKFFRELQGLDITIISSLFFMRSAFPYSFADVGISPWFLVVVLFFSLAIISGKRLAELEIGHTRKTLNSYTKTQLQILVASFWTLTIVSYTAWLQNQESNFNLFWGIASLFVFVSIFIRILPHLLGPKSESPEDLLLEDKGNIVLGVIWLLFYLLAKGYL